MKMNNNNNKNIVKKRGNRKPNTGQAGAMSPSLLRSGPFPVQMRRWLPYIENTIVVQGASPFVILERRINDPFDPNAALGGISASGFGVLAQAYNSYHVEKFKCRFSVANNEGYGIQFGVIFRDAQPSLSLTTYALALNALSIRPSTGKYQVAQASGNSLFPRTQWLEADPGVVIGNQKSYMSDVDFTATTAANPAQIVWMAFVLLSPSAILNLTNGCFLDLELAFYTRFFSLLNVII